MRALRVLLIIAVILGGLFVAADRLAVYAAESRAADRISLQQSTAASKDVSIKGFPFLTQVADKRLDEVEVTLTGIRTSASGRPVRISELTADLYDVRLGDGYGSAVAARAQGEARISYEDLSAVAEEGVSVAYGENGKVKVTGSVEVLGRTVTRSVTSTVSLVGDDTVRVRADSVPGEGIPGIEDLVRKKTDFDRRLGGLPAGLKLEKVEAKPDGVVFTVTGENISLAG
ncbi:MULTISPECIES: LmeA family phospholipid-binding protein [Streptomyces]|uniref:DUF2993 domain-containing protein n=1 Tax=Streptomyces chengmaiensis TaxID=3040919 RepID=A0ABT6HVG4_9ACTN|nr:MULTISPECIES: DUF2993 domain-containing protein [Streptomyces]MDH2392706.1 DUF2993 domain-containing protein [Streptomyces chengmaiensis]WRQ83005.1 DUF2993 domain-containing protein [Streptomyces sp. MUM 178J]